MVLGYQESKVGSVGPSSWQLYADPEAPCWGMSMHTYLYTHIMYLHVYIYICIYICVGGEGGKIKGRFWQSWPACLCLKTRGIYLGVPKKDNVCKDLGCRV